MFSNENKTSKQDLIARLNIITMDIDNIINDLSSKKLQKKFRYLLYVSSVNDPGQFINFNHIIDEALEDLNKKLSKQTKLASAFTLAFLASLVWKFNHTNSSRDSNYPPGLGLLTSSLSGYELYSIHHTKKEISKLNSIKTIINKNAVYNEMLSKMLNPEDINFREEFFNKHIKADQLAELKEKLENKKSKGSFVLWKPTKNMQIGHAKFPELKLNLDNTTRSNP